MPSRAVKLVVRLTPAGPPVPPRVVAVVVDVLRASTTLTVAFANGAAGLLPVTTAAEAFALRERLAGAVLCGERDGRRLPGFDLGNSPYEYAAATVGGRTLVYASTNGSLALLAARNARRRVLGAFVSARAVLEAVAREAEVEVVCAGRLGGFCLEDAAFAGWLCQELAARGARIAGAAAGFARALAPRGAAEVRALLQGAAQGRQLRRLGADYARDLEFCATLDRFDRAFEV